MVKKKEKKQTNHKLAWWGRSTKFVFPIKSSRVTFSHFYFGYLFPLIISQISWKIHRESGSSNFVVLSNNKKRKLWIDRHFETVKHFILFSSQISMNSWPSWDSFRVEFLHKNYTTEKVIFVQDQVLDPMGGLLYVRMWILIKTEYALIHI